MHEDVYDRPLYDLTPPKFDESLSVAENIVLEGYATLTGADVYMGARSTGRAYRKAYR